MKKRGLFYSLAVLVIVAAVGFAAYQFSTTRSYMAPGPLEPETKQENVVKNPHSVSVFKVVDEKGKYVKLDLKDGPILFLAHWCPHCNKYLETHKPNPNIRVVAVYPMEGETVGQMIAGVKEKLKATGWDNVKVYGSMDREIVDVVPTIAYIAKGTSKRINAFEVEGCENALYPGENRKIFFKFQRQAFLTLS